MSDKQSINIKSKLKKNNKEKIVSKKERLQPLSNQSKNEKLIQKNMNLKSITPIKTDKTKNSNINNNKTIVIPPNNANYNINNNISININISVSNNDNLNKRHQSISGTQNKSVEKKKPISIKKDELKSGQNLIMKTSTVKSNNNEKAKKSKSIHESLHSANYASKDNRINKTNKQNQYF